MTIRNASKRSASRAAHIDAIVLARTGVSRHTRVLAIQGVRVQSFITAPVIVRERWIRVPRHYNYAGEKIRGRNYHFAILRYSFRGQDGLAYSALQGRVCNADKGYALSVTGFWNLRQTGE